MVMLKNKLIKIFNNQQKDHFFYNETIQPALKACLTEANFDEALSKLQFLLKGSMYETAIDHIDHMKQTSLTSKQTMIEHLTHFFWELKQKHDTERAEETEGHIDAAPMLQLKPSALFYATAIFNQHEHLESLTKAMSYAAKALEYAKLNPAKLNLSPISDDDALELDRSSATKPLSKPPVENDRPLSPTLPSLGYAADRKLFHKERRALNVDAKAAQALRLRLSQQPKPQLGVMAKEDNARLAPIVCKNCGAKGHFAGTCLRPRKP